RKELVDARNDADQMIYATEKAIEESGDKIDEADKNMLSEAVKKAKEDIEKAEDAATVRNIIEEMTKANGPIFTKLYQAAAEAEANANKGDDNDNNGGEGETIIEND
ncbi:MAG: Hsp70 family protein, partial [Clostridia bacterium]|nr:Hsp70 family protein [Clostridia bacterium]